MNFIKSQKDFFAGLMYIVIGAAFAIAALDYNVGTAARMGPGYFPLALGIILAIIGALVSFNAIVQRGLPGGDPVGRWAWRQVFFILAANFVFGILLVGVPAWGVPSFGLICAIYGLVLVASYARVGASFEESLIVATVLAVGSYLVFIKALSLQFPVWPAFFSA